MNRNTYIKLGLIFIFTIFIIIWGINFLKGKDIFNKEDLYYVVYDRVDGLQISNPVLINGYKVGQVREIKFMEDNSGRLLVTLTMQSQFQIPIPTTARIFSSDLMGTKSIELLFPKSDKMQSPGDTLIADFEGSLQEMVSLQMLPLKNNAENLMKEMEEAIAMVKYIFNEQNRENISQSFASVKRTFQTLERSASSMDTIMKDGVGKMEHILTNVEGITLNLKENNKKISNILNNLSSITDSLAQADLKAIAQNMEQTLNQLSIILENIQKGEGSLGKMAKNDTLYYNLEDVTYNLNRLLEDIRINPKRYVHVSAFDFGKTVYVKDKTPAGNEKEKKYYSIKIASSNKPIELKPENFRGIKNVNESIFNGIYTYTVGKKKHLKKIESMLEEVRQSYPDAEIIEISEGEYQRIN